MAGRILRPGTGPIYRGNKSGIFAPGVGRIGGHDASLGKAQVPAYLGQVATRSYMNSGVAASTSGWNSVTAHYARDTIVNPQLLFGNFRVNAGVGEVGNAGNIQTNTASIEYPTSNRVQAMNGASTQLVLSELTYGTMTVPITIPKGSLFLVRRFQTNTVGLFFSATTDRKLNAALGDATENNNTDKTMSGTVAAGGVNIIAPQGILAMTRLPSIGSVGSSRTTGAGDVTVDVGGDTGYTRFWGPSFAYMDFAVGGDKLVPVVGSAGALRRAIIAQYCTHFHIDPGLNDINGGGNAASVLTAINSLAAGWTPGLSKVLINDEAPWTTTTDAWATSVNQAVKNSPAGFEAQRVALTSGVQALTGLNQIMTPSIIEGNGTNNQFWNNPAVGGIQYTIDGIHEISAALIATKNAGVFNSALVVR